jgi:hypothetical protein
MRKLLLTIILIIIGQPALATPSPDELRAMAYSGNVDGIEAAYVAIHAEERAGGISYDELRELYLALVVYDPRVLGFTQDWLDAYPNSLHAHAIRARQLYLASFAIRGEANPRNTYPLALEGFRQLKDEALSHAWTAFQSAPDLVFASDSLLALQRTHRFMSAANFDQFVRDIFAVTPNHQSLIWATETAEPQWGGGGSSEVRRLCNQFAPMVRDIQNYDADTCFIEAIFHSATYIRDRAVIQEANFLLERNDHPILGRARLFQAFEGLEDLIEAGGSEIQTYHSGPEDARIVANVILDPDFRDFEKADTYDRMFARPLGIPRLLPMMVEREVTWAQDRIVDDPFDPAAIVDLTRLDFYGVPTPNPLSFEERQALLKRRLMVNPYSSEAWIDLALLIDANRQPHTSVVTDPYYINAIVYSNYGVRAVVSFLNVKSGRISGMRYLEDRDSMNRHISEALFVNGYCPYLRLVNLRQFLCEGPRLGDMSCGFAYGANSEQMYAEALQRATDANLCIAERRANPEDLAFEPVTVDLQP